MVAAVGVTCGPNLGDLGHDQYLVYRTSCASLFISITVSYFENKKYIFTQKGVLNKNMDLSPE